MFSLPREGHFPSCYARDDACLCIERGYRSLVIIALFLWLFELAGGLLAGSQSLLSDAFHVFSDIGVYLVAWYGIRLARRQVSNKKILQNTGHLVRGIILVAASCIIAMALYELIFSRANIAAVYDAKETLFYGAIGFIANVWMYLFLRGLTFSGEHQHRTASGAHIHHGALLHTLGDLLGSVFVMIVAVGVMFSLVAPWADRIVAIGIGLWLIYQVLRGPSQHDHHAH